MLALLFRRSDSLTIHVDGLASQKEGAQLESAIETLPGVHRASVQGSDAVQVTYVPGQVDVREMLRVVKRQGFSGKAV